MESNSSFISLWTLSISSREFTSNDQAAGFTLDYLTFSPFTASMPVFVSNDLGIPAY